MLTIERIPCLNPQCKRTAAPSADGSSEQIVCGKCWRRLPQGLRDRDRALRRRERRLLRLIEKRAARNAIGPRAIEQVHRLYQASFDRNWQRIRNYFQQPDRPIGLEGFLQEIGL